MGIPLFANNIRFYGPAAGAILRQVRGANLQKVWAEKAKIRQADISRYETGEASFDLEVIEDYCRVDGIPVDPIINQMVIAITEKKCQSTLKTSSI